MRIGINLLYLIPGKAGGTHTYAYSLLKALDENNNKHQFFVFVNSESAKLDFGLSERFHIEVCPTNATNRLARYLWEQTRLPQYARRYKLDLLHSFGYVGPLFVPCKHVVTVHDVSYIALSKIIPWRRQLGLRLFVTWSARRADKVITVSKFSQQQIERHIGIEPDNIRVVYEGIYPLSVNEALLNDVRTHYGLPESYLVAFSSASLHKNIEGLLEAFSLLLDRIPHQMLLIGHLPDNFQTLPVVKKLLQENRLIMTGYVPTEHVAPLLKMGTLFVFPSFYEGFGLPVLEAQSLGVPTLLSNRASLPEVGRDAVVYFDPTNKQEMVEKISSVLQNDVMLAEMRDKGLENVGYFSWEKTANETLSVYREILMRG